MKRWLKKIHREAPLRAGLAIMYIYSGADLIINPGNWQWALESALPKIPTPIQSVIEGIGFDLFLQIQGGIELLFAAVLLAWFAPRKIVRTVALFIIVELAAILALTGIDTITFRDIGLLGGAATLYLSYLRREY